MERKELTQTELTEEQLERLKRMREYENPKPRNRAERRMQAKQKRKKNRRWLDE